MFLTELDLKLSSMYRFASFFLLQGSLKCDLNIQKSFFSYVKVSSDFRQHSGNRFGGIGIILGEILRKENESFQVKKFIKTLKIIKDSQNACGE